MAKTPDETPIGNVDGDEDKYENMMLTPNGSIVAMIGDKELKPETDPDWEALQAERPVRVPSASARCFTAMPSTRTAVTDPLLTWG